MRFLPLLFFILSIYSAIAREISVSNFIWEKSGRDNEAKSFMSFDDESAMSFGSGYDSLTDSVMGDCVILDRPESPNESRAKKVTFTIEQVTSIQSLFEKFNVSASASLKKGFGSITGKTRFLLERNLSEYSIYVLAKVQVTNVMTRLRNVRLLEEAVNIYLKDPEHFRRICGDEFIVSMTTGGEFYALLEIETKNSKERQEVMASLRGRIGTFKGEGEFSRILSEITERRKSRVMIYQVGGNFDPKVGVPTTPDDIIAHAKVYDQTVKGADAMPISVSTLPYTNTINFPPSRTDFDTKIYKSVINSMIKYQDEYLQKVANIVCFR